MTVTSTGEVLFFVCVCVCVCVRACVCVRMPERACVFVSEAMSLVICSCEK